MLKFRNIGATPDDPVTEWGVEGMCAAIERGGLADWRRIATEIRQHPDGAAARDLEEARGSMEPCGGWMVLSRALAEARIGPRAIVTRHLQHAVRRTGMPLREFAALVGTSHSRLATYLSGEVSPSADMALKIESIGRTHRL